MCKLTYIHVYVNGWIETDVFLHNKKIASIKGRCASKNIEDINKLLNESIQKEITQAS